MGINGNGYRPVRGFGAAANGAAENGLLSSKSVQDLLAEFEQTGRQEPFAEIVRRYAGMVYNVCYQVSKDAHDAEDATQAVFLTLAVRSKTAQKIQYLGPWLQRVAQRLSLDMKRSKKRRSAREMKHHDLNVGRWEENNGPADLGMDELRGILRDEIDKLPAKYRMPLILHYFGGLKPDELSKELGIKANTLGVRLHRARKMLGENLERRGIVVGGAMLAAALASMIPFYVQSTVVNRTATAAASWALGHHVVSSEIAANVLGLMRGAQRAAILGKIKAVTAAVAIGVSAVAGAGELINRYKPFGLEFRNPLDLRSLFGPLLERLRSPVRISEARPTVDEVLAKATAQSDWSPGDAAPQAPFASSPRINQYAPVGDEVALAALASPAEQFHVERHMVLPPIRPIPDPVLPPSSPAVIAAVPVAGASTAVVREPVAVIRSAQGLSAPAPAALTANDRFAAARVTYAHAGGTLDLPAITLDSRSAPVRSFSISSGQVRADRLVIGETGEADLTHTGGRVEARQLALGVHPGASGSYHLSGAGDLAAELQDVGVAGNGAFLQNGGTNSAITIALGQLPTGNGTYTLRDGKIFAQNFRVGVAGKGEFNLDGGEAVIRSSPTASTSAAPAKLAPDDEPRGFVVALRDDSTGTVNLGGGGALTSDSLVVGFAGHADYNQRDGKTTAKTFLLAGGDDSKATMRVTRGEVVFDAADADGADPPRSWRESLARRQSLFTNSPAETHALIASGRAGNALIVGNGGDALLQLGNRSSTARLSEASPRSFTPIIIGATPSADATVAGYGVVGLTGPLVQNGRVIADAFGRRGRALDFSAVAVVENTIQNPHDGDAGWYAQRGGALDLPAVRVPGDGAYNWGESSRDERPDLVNSVRFTFGGVTAAGSIDVTLLSPEIALTDTGAPPGEIFVGLWKLDRQGALGAAVTDLLVRYDQKAVDKLGVHEGEINLWAYTDAGKWIALADERARLDVDDNLIGGAFDRTIEYFAVGVPGAAEAALAAWLSSALLPEVPLRSVFMRLEDCTTAAEFALFVSGAGAPASAARPGAVPEPTAGAVIAISSAALFRRRRRRP